ncbi:MAG: hypothetical protein AAFX99_34170 [Myxococcota bacterium]
MRPLFTAPAEPEAVERLGGKPSRMIVLGCGLRIQVEQHGERLHVAASAAEPKHVRYHLRAWNLELEAVEGVSDGALTWELWRQDDNGNDFLMATFASERAAQCVADLFEARGHKQSYWVSPKGSETGWTDSLRKEKGADPLS